MGLTAEFIAQHMDISREEMDVVAFRSQNNVERANNDGSFDDEIVPIEIPRKRKEANLLDWLHFAVGGECQWHALWN
jgi:acetyl-CoA C-acetyltransferase